AQRLEALSALTVHPRDQQVNSVLMARLERLYQESLGDLRERAGSLAQDFQRALDSQDERVIRDARKSLAERLDRLERRL
ncbi:molecular chaperone HscC, partial [Pseudomonas sp. HR1]|nr:molecular chaperone HscC [Pseudomonas sp. HR1]